MIFKKILLAIYRTSIHPNRYNNVRQPQTSDVNKVF